MVQEDLCISSERSVVERSAVLLDPSLRLEFGEDLELGDVVEHYEGGEDQ